MASSPACLTHTAMTRTVNKIKLPNSFLRNKLFSSRVTYPTKEVEWGVLSADREMAKFVREGSQARFVAQLDEDRKLVTFPMIREKKVLKANEGMFQRHVGSVIFASKGEMISAYQAAVARELRDLSYRIANREEWMCAQALTGTLAYTDADGANFNVVYGKPAGHDADATDFDVVWTNSAADPAEAFEAARAALDDEEGLPLTDAIMDNAAGQLFMGLAAVKTDLDRRNYEVGALAAGLAIRADGAQYLGIYHNTRCWIYRRESVEDGVGTALIRANHVEFVSDVREADTEIAFGAITDQAALEDGILEAERFSKSWMTEDPGHRVALVESHPLPVMRKPGMVFSLDTAA